MIATAPGKLILTGEYAVLDGAPALVIAIDRRVIARRTPARQATPYGSSPFLLAVARELAARLGDDHPAAHAALEIAVDSSAFYDGAQKLGLGSSAAVTVATTALALASSSRSSGVGTHAGSSSAASVVGGPSSRLSVVGASPGGAVSSGGASRASNALPGVGTHAGSSSAASVVGGPSSGGDVSSGVGTDAGSSGASVGGSSSSLSVVGASPGGAVSSGGAARASNATTQLDRQLVLDIALAAHANAQGERGARGSGADIAAAVYGGTIVYTIIDCSVDAGVSPSDGEVPRTSIERRRWPAGVTLIPFFTGASADTATLVDRVNAAHATHRDAVDAALAAIAAASQAACAALAAPVEMAAAAVISALRLAAAATDRLAIASGVELVPACVASARKAMQPLGGTAKTTGAGGGDVGVAVIPATADATLARSLLIEAGCQPLQLSVDDTGVDTRPEPK